MRYRWDPKRKALVPLTAPVSEKARLQLMLDSKYEGLRATDGTDVGSRRKWQEYARIHGLTHADDYKNYWKQKRKERDVVARGEPWGTKERTQAIREAWEKVAHGYKPHRRDFNSESDGPAPFVVDSYLFKE